MSKLNLFTRIYLGRPYSDKELKELSKKQEEERVSRTAENNVENEAVNTADNNTDAQVETATETKSDAKSTTKNDKGSGTDKAKADKKGTSDSNSNGEAITKTIVEEMAEAAMAAPNAQPAGLGVDFSYFTGNQPVTGTPNPAQGSAPGYMPYGQVQQTFVQNPNAPVTGAPIPQQPAANGAAPVVGKGRHKVDNPPPKKPEVKKAEADNVNVDLDLVDGPEVKPGIVRETPDIIKTQNIKPADPIPVPPAKFDNEALIAQYKFLGLIEKTARECGAQVKFEMRPGSNGKPSGLITCLTYTADVNNPNPYKSFTIDTGVIIDRRAKVLIGNPATDAYEDMQMYLILVSASNPDERSKNKNNVFNEKLFKDIFTGGYQMLEPSRMYTKELLELNKHVALISMPTNAMTSESRKAVRSRLLAAAKEGVFTKALEKEPKARFRFDNNGYNKKTMEFVLTTAGTPYRFCGPCYCQKTIKLAFKADGTTVLSEE